MRISTDAVWRTLESGGFWFWKPKISPCCFSTILVTDLVLASRDLTTRLSSAFLISWGRVAGVSANFFDTAAVFDPAAARWAADGGGGADSANWFSRLLGEAAPPVALGGGDPPQLGKAMAEDKVKNTTTAKRVVLLLVGFGFGLCGEELLLR